MKYIIKQKSNLDCISISGDLFVFVNSTCCNLYNRKSESLTKYNIKYIEHLIITKDDNNLIFSKIDKSIIFNTNISNQQTKQCKLPCKGHIDNIFQNESGEIFVQVEIRDLNKNDELKTNFILYKYSCEENKIIEEYYINNFRNVGCTNVKNELLYMKNNSSRKCF